MTYCLVRAVVLALLNALIASRIMVRIDPLAGVIAWLALTWISVRIMRWEISL